jgi:hypothetical protein
MQERRRGPDDDVPDHVRGQGEQERADVRRVAVDLHGWLAPTPMQGAARPPDH